MAVWERGASRERVIKSERMSRRENGPLTMVWRGSSYCCCTVRHPKTEWLKTTIILLLPTIFVCQAFRRNLVRGFGSGSDDGWSWKSVGCGRGDVSSWKMIEHLSLSMGSWGFSVWVPPHVLVWTSLQHGSYRAVGLLIRYLQAPGKVLFQCTRCKQQCFSLPNLGVMPHHFLHILLVTRGSWACLDSRGGELDLIVWWRSSRVPKSKRDRSYSCGHLWKMQCHSERGGGLRNLAPPESLSANCPWNQAKSPPLILLNEKLHRTNQPPFLLCSCVISTGYLTSHHLWAFTAHLQSKFSLPSPSALRLKLKVLCLLL